MVRSPRLAVLIGLWLSGLSGARGGPESLVYENGLWPKKAIRVCFGNARHFRLTDLPRVSRPLDEDHAKSEGRLTVDAIAALPDSLRREVRSLVEREFSPARTGVHFVGWRSCSATATEADVVILASKPDFRVGEDLGWASIGRNLEVDEDGLPNATLYPEAKGFVYLKHPSAISIDDDGGYPLAVTREQRFLTTALHEFGHVVGLGHEHPRVYRGVSDLNCQWTARRYREVREEAHPDGLGERVIVTGDYDPNSIMNYCWTRAMSTISGRDFVIDRALPEFAQKIEAPAPGSAEPPRHVGRPRKNAENALPPNAIELKDETLFVAEPISETKTRYRLRLGLSRGDLHSIRCAYLYAGAEKNRLCPKLPGLPRAAAIPVDPPSPIAPVRVSARD